MKRIYLTLVIALFLSFHAKGNELIKEWTFKSSNDLKQVQFSYLNPENKFLWNISEKEKTPDGDNSLEVMIINERPDALVYEKQVNFRHKYSLIKKQKYRIEFWCKGSINGEISLTVAEADYPYTVLGHPDKVNKTIELKDKWQKISLDFFPVRDFNGVVAAPRLMLAHYPALQRVYIGPVKFTVLNKNIPLKLNPVWKVFTGVKAEAAIISAFKNIPEELPGDSGAAVSPKKTQLKNNTIDLAELAGTFKAKKVAVLFNEFYSPDNGYMQIGTSADWWFEFAVNGRTVYSTLKTGNTSPVYMPEDHVFNIPVLKGKNLIVVKVLSGSCGWKFVAGKVKFRNSNSSLQKITAGKEWKAVNLDNICVKAGTALDLSALCKREPAGTYGRVVINSKGAMAFAEKKDIPVRFWSFNMGPGRFINYTNEDLDQYAQAIANQGYNMIRLHYSNALWMGTQGSPKLISPETKLAEQATEIPFSKKGIDRFDYLVAALKKRGIYINLDAMAGSAGFTDCSPWWTPHKEKHFSLQLLVNSRYRNNWKAGLDYVLNHGNPYTGTKLVDDPVLANLEFFNEQDFHINNTAFQNVIRPSWHKYLKDKYKSIEKLREAWTIFPLSTDVKSFDSIPMPDERMLRSRSTAANDGGQFLINKMTEMTKWYYDAVQDLGYNGLVTQWDMIMRTMEVPVRALMPVIAQHTYFCHPGHRKEKGKTLTIVGQSSSLNSSYLRAAAATRFANRPFMITEYSHSAFNKYRHERGLYFGAYAALQGWDSLAAHSGTVMLKPDPVHTFERASDPISRAAEVVTAFAWLRGDVKESSHLIELKLEKKNLFPKNYLAAVGDDYAQLAMLTKIGISYPEVKPMMPVGKAQPDLEVTPERFSRLGISSWYVSAATSYGNKFPLLVDELREKGILPETNKTNPRHRIYQSETGEIELNGRSETMTVITPRLEGVIIKKNTPVKLRKINVTQCSAPASVTVISLNKSQNIENSERLLVVFSTNALNTDMVFENSYTMREIGKLPILMQTAKLNLTIKTTLSSAKVYALNIDGTRAEEIPVTIKDGKLILNIDTNTLKYCTPFFEITEK